MLGSSRIDLALQQLRNEEQKFWKAREGLSESSKVTEIQKCVALALRKKMQVMSLPSTPSQNAAKQLEGEFFDLVRSLR